MDSTETVPVSDAWGGGSVRRQEIFRIAADLFYQKGYPQTSTRDIAEAAGILKGSLYAHISSKEDILYAIILDVHRNFEANMAACEADNETDPLDRLRGFLAGHMRVAMSLLKSHQIYTRDWRSLSEDRFRTIRGKRAAYEDYLAGLLAAAQQAGQVRSDAESRLLALSMLSSLNSVHIWYRDGGKFSADTVADTYCSMVLQGIMR
jgi:TetR/AcrR family transcriptional regulator, cholesterol catabolism regulator